jgi:hypothetical protein
MDRTDEAVMIRRLAAVVVPLLSSVVILLTPGGRADAGIGLDFFESSSAPVVSPIQPFIFPTGELPFNFDTRPELFEPLLAGQQAESMILGVRLMVRDARRDAEIRAVLDKIARWSQRVEAVRRDHMNGAAIEASAQKDPRNLRLMARLARHHVRQLELERADVLAKTPPAFRHTMDIRVNPKTAGWQDESGLISGFPSAAFPRAQAAVQAALALDANDPEALLQAAALYRRQFTSMYGRTEDPRAYWLRAKASGGSAAAVADVHLALSDPRPGNLRAKAADLRTAKSGSHERYERRPDGSVWKVVEPWHRDPTRSDLADANALEAEAARIDAEMRAILDAVLRREPLNAHVFSRFAESRRGLSGERALRYALLLDPSDFRLHGWRAILWAVAKQSTLELASDYAAWVLRKDKAGTFFVKIGFADDMRGKYKDPFTAYVIALETVRVRPAHPLAHQRLALALQRLTGQSLPGGELMPDAARQARLAWGVAYHTAARMLDHPEEWERDDSRSRWTEAMEIAQRAMKALENAR